MAKNTKPILQKNTELKISIVSFKKVLKERIALGKELWSEEIKNQPQFDENVSRFNLWNDYNLEYLKQSFDPPYNEYRKHYENAGVWTYTILTGRSKSPVEKVAEFKDKINSKINNLESLYAKSDLLPSNVTIEPLPEKPIENMLTKKIFIVHGHDDRTKLEIARTIEKLGLIPIILHEQPNEGRTIIEKFELHSDVSFAIVLMTCDDLGRSKLSDVDTFRARQNVILELGYFIGKLGRNRVFPLYEDGVELPSDLYGLLYNPLDERGSWKFQLVKELKAVGYDVSADSII